MGVDKKVLEQIQGLVGDIAENNLKYVDCYVNENFGLFLPSVGFCKYAITPHHTHPAYSFVLFFSEEQCIIPVEVEVSQNHYLAVAMSPDIAHEEEEKNPVFFLATVEDEEPRVRGMLLYKADENGIIFHTGTMKALYEQVLKNPKVELCFSGDGTQVRVSGKLEIIEDNNIRLCFK